MMTEKENYFTLLGLEQGFDIDMDALEQCYFAMQQEFHPDRFAGKSQQERLASLQQSTTINTAYNTLKDPLKRAEYLLSLEGLAVNAEQGGVQPPQALLMEAMEQREALMEAETTEQVTVLGQQAEENKQEVINKLSVTLKSGDYKNAAQLAIQLKYLEKFSDEIRMKRGKL